jgi:hypothetical protein
VICCAILGTDSGRIYRWVRIRRTIDRSSASAVSLLSQSSADCTTNTVGRSIQQGQRTHLSVDKDSPAHRPIQPYGQLAAQPILGGLHHQYCRM